MPRPRQFTEEMVYITMRVPRSMVDDAALLGVNMSAAGRDGIRNAIECEKNKIRHIVESVKSA